MPKYLIVAATKFEIEPLLKHFKFELNANEGFFAADNNPVDLSILLTGVGMVNTAFYMGKYFSNKYDYTINMGICGAFKRNIEIGEVINIVSDTLSELGAENGEEFIKLEDLNMGGKSVFTSRFQKTPQLLKQIKSVNGITVNTVHGNNRQIEKAISLFNPDAESMEGASFFRACEGSDKNYLQLRAVSNYVEKRDRSKWNIPLAINNINEFVIKLIEELNNDQS